MHTQALEQIPAVARDSVAQYAERVLAYGGNHVLGLILYGPIAGARFDPTLHMIHSVLVLDGMGLEILRKLSGEGHRFGRRRITAPMVMTPDFLQASRDTFPLELIEIQQQRLVLVGEDYFAGITFDPAHVRLQCERELKALSVAMRQAVVADGDKESSIQRAALPAMFNLLRVLRGMLWVKGKTESLVSSALLAEVEALAGRHLPGIRQALDAPSAVDWLVFERLYNDVEALGQIADGW
ncbi:MAG TPA: hypothetical protein VGN12_21265 [Pirellulales bacterium]|jgi:hypothetical protein